MKSWRVALQRSATMKSSLCSDEIQGDALDEIKSVQITPCKAGFHRESDFIHQRWISPVEDGFVCVFSVKENTHRARGFGCRRGARGARSVFNTLSAANAPKKHIKRNPPREGGFLPKKAASL